MRFIFLIFIVFSLASNFSFPAWSKTTCHTGSNNDERIRLCSKIINSKTSKRNKSNAYRSRGEAYLFKGEYQKAINDLTNSIKRIRTAWNYSLRADAYEKLGKTDAMQRDRVHAIDYYEREIEEFDGYWVLHLGIAKEYLKANKPEIGLEHINIAIEKKTNEANNHHIRAKIYQALGRFEEAINDWEIASKLKPFDEKYKLNLANVRKDLKLTNDTKKIETTLEATHRSKDEKLQAEKQATQKQTEVAKTELKPKVITRTGKRIALVIGNDNYANLPSYYQLKKAQNDARSTAETFKSLGFDVMSGFDLKRRDMNIKLSKIANKIEPGDEVMFFFAGHGVRIEGQNYLLPSDVPTINDANQDLLKSESLNVELISDMFRKRGARLSLLILDACRNNPYKDTRGRSIGGTRGLAPMEPAEGTHVIYSAGAGQEALDRLSDDDKNPNSVFTRTFLPMVKQQGLELSRLSKLLKGKVRDLAKSVGHKQTPAVYSEVIGDVYLAAP